MASSPMHRRLVVVRFVDRLIDVAAGMCRVLAGVAAVTLIMFVIDYQIHRMSMGARAVAWACIVVAAVYFLLRFLVGPLEE